MKSNYLLLGAIGVVVALVAVLIAYSYSALTQTTGPKALENGAKSKLIGTFTIQSTDQIARQECVRICEEKKGVIDLSNGPCLSNAIAPDWVCDVVHDPRTDTDNDPANQCSAFGTSAKHFVEVDTECKFVRQI